MRTDYELAYLALRRLVRGNAPEDTTVLDILSDQGYDVTAAEIDAICRVEERIQNRKKIVRSVDYRAKMSEAQKQVWADYKRRTASR